MTETMSEGYNLMLYGMGFVFVFLALLVLSTYFMSFCLRFTHHPKKEAQPQATLKAINQQSIDPDILSAITIAVSRYRAKHKT